MLFRSAGGTVGTHLQMGIGDGLIPDNLNTKIYSHICIVSDEDALNTSRDLARKEGLMVGISAGTNVFAALELARKLGPGITPSCEGARAPSGSSLWGLPGALFHFGHRSPGFHSSFRSSYPPAHPPPLRSSPAGLPSRDPHPGGAPGLPPPPPAHLQVSGAWITWGREPLGLLAFSSSTSVAAEWGVKRRERKEGGGGDSEGCPSPF